MCTPSGNFGNLTAGLMAKRAGLPIARFVAATNVNDVVPQYLESGQFAPRPSVRTIANAMDVGHPSNFERMRWLYRDDVEAMRHDIAGIRYTDDEVRGTIKRVYETRGYLLDPHSAIGYMGLKAHLGQVAAGRAGGDLPRDGAPGEVPGDRRTGHRPRHPDAGAACRGAGPPAARPADGRVAGSGCRGPSWLTTLRLRSGQVHRTGIALTSSPRFPDTASFPHPAPHPSSSATTSGTCTSGRSAVFASGIFVASFRRRSTGSASINSGVGIPCWRSSHGSSSTRGQILPGDGSRLSMSRRTRLAPDPPAGCLVERLVRPLPFSRTSTSEPRRSAAS